MATGSYSCSSNRAEVSDTGAVKDLLNRYKTYNQSSFTSNGIKFSSESDTLKIDGPDGGEGERSFLEELVEYLEERLVITNYIDPPRSHKRTGRWVVDPNSGVSYETDDT